MKSKKDDPPPPYEDLTRLPPYAVKAPASQSGPAYRLFLHYNQMEVTCSLNQGISIEAVGYIDFLTTGIPKFSVHRGSAPIEEVINPIDPNEYLTIVLEHDKLNYLKELISIFTSHEYWNYFSYMPPRFELAHSYHKTYVKETVRTANKSGRLSLLVLSINQYFVRRNSMNVDFFGVPQEECKYSLHVIFKRSFAELDGRFKNLKGEIEHIYGATQPAVKAMVLKNDEVLDSQVKEYYNGPTLEFVIKSPSLATLEDLKERYLNPTISTKNNRKIHAQMIRIYDDSLESIEEGKTGSQKITVKFQDHRIIYRPFVNFNGPWRWD